VDDLSRIHDTLISEDDPRESFMRFQVLRRGFFDFNAIEIKSLLDKEALLEIDYSMGKKAEEAASYQAMGFFERIAELSGGKNVRVTFTKKSWEGDPTTAVKLTWE